VVNSYHLYDYEHTLDVPLVPTSCCFAVSCWGNAEILSHVFILKIILIKYYGLHPEKIDDSWVCFKGKYFWHLLRKNLALPEYVSASYAM